jgi:hypothetical protein
MTDLALPTEQQARALTDRIKVAVEGTWLLIQEAYTSRAWAALGYDTWDAYCSAEFGTARLRLPREERQEVVASLRESGLSVRAIASATGSSIGTVAADLDRCSEMNTSAVTGTDGKTYTPRPTQPDTDLIAGDDWTPEPAPEPKVKRRPLPEAFTDAGRDLTRATERLARLTEDDRFAKNRDTTRHQVPELIGALERTTALVTALDLPGAEASEEARRWWATSLHKIADALLDVANSIHKEQ